MRVLVGFEHSGVVRDAFIARGHAAYSCDFLPGEGENPEYHYEDDFFYVVTHDGPWDVVIAHPPCTYLASSGIHHNARSPLRAARTERALDVVSMIFRLPAYHFVDHKIRLCVENPVGVIATRLAGLIKQEGIESQIVQPWQFGDDASKRTVLWLKGLKPLTMDPWRAIMPRMVNGRPRWANQLDTGQNRLGQTKGRAKERSLTYPGIAEAMAEQWGHH